MGTKRKAADVDKLEEKKKLKAKRKSSKERDQDTRVDKEQNILPQRCSAVENCSGISASINDSDCPMNNGLSKRNLPFQYKYIMAPMVGASELPFRLLCRKYGAQLCYTPMMIASEFAKSETYRQNEFQTTSFDRPLVCHFAANNPEEFASAAKLAEPYCDAIDLNLGCPQRTAYIGHFGSYLLDTKDRTLVLNIVKAGVEAVSIPIFVKIRLLDSYEETFELVQGLYGAGASLVAVHARYRASFHRKGPGARDGPALLEQVEKLKKAFPNNILVTNGNTITFDDVVGNLETTNADGLMSAEGILDNPALFLGRFGPRTEESKKGKKEKIVLVKGGAVLEARTREGKLLKKMRKIAAIEDKAKNVTTTLTPKESKRLSKKRKVQEKLNKLDRSVIARLGDEACSEVSLKELYADSDDKPKLAIEYLNLVRNFPATIRTVIFHTRRILKTELMSYQLMEECLACTTLDAVESIIKKIIQYRNDPSSFSFDREKAKKEKEALERKKQEEGKRKAYEARMIRKAKREGRKDLEHYLRQGAEVPSEVTVKELRSLDRQEQLHLWKERNHSQHCMAFHLNGECQRGRSCAFLHVALSTQNTFDEAQEVAG